MPKLKYYQVQQALNQKSQSDKVNQTKNRLRSKLETIRFSRANCYGYALHLDYVLTPGSANANAIDWDNMHVIDTTRIKELMDACIADGLSSVNIGTYKIAVFINQYQAGGLDYHFYRQDPDSSWSHKLGNTGKITMQLPCPKIANACLVGVTDHLGHTITQQAFCGHLYMNPALNAETFDL
ncbi:hypothetical protein R6242_18285 [Iodobacter sp. CM08]|uniref:hypothetical protein n=1 Tax=Iodobacter sp. CM08 TaxID=3085902 RepID=UPI002981E8A2|nr:hypothetical protein [Iodobacter sp. CM08]MDW5418516.1 hypothetical protein [Iodobacter sp. CM08]